jgi:hypothetical protein
MDRIQTKKIIAVVAVLANMLIMINISAETVDQLFLIYIYKFSLGQTAIQNCLYCDMERRTCLKCIE